MAAKKTLPGELSVISIKKILYPTDFSEYSSVALPYAVDFAHHYNAELHCLHAVEWGHEFIPTGDNIAPMITPPVLSVEEMQKTAQKRLEAFLRDKAPQIAGSVIKKVVLGKPFVEIIGYCRQENIDLIVLGTHGHSALASMLLGSVAEKVVRKAPCAVLTVRHPEHKFVAP